MSKTPFCLLVALLGWLVAPAALAEVTLVHAGELLAVPGSAPVARKTIIIEGDRVTGVQDGFLQVEGATVIDLSDKFVLPGLMDMHVHLQGEYGPHNDRDALKMSDQLMQMRSIHGPRIIAAGGVGITGGHADVSGAKPDLLEFYTSPNVCDGPYDCRRAARNVIKYGADLIKITSTGGVMTQRATGTGQQMEMDELREVVRQHRTRHLHRPARDQAVQGNRRLPGAHVAGRQDGRGDGARIRIHGGTGA